MSEQPRPTPRPVGAHLMSEQPRPTPRPVGAHLMSEQTATDIHKDLSKIAPKRLNRRNGRDSGGFGSQDAGSE